MKLLISGDLHGSAKWTNELKKLVDKENPSRLLLLGDLLSHGPRNPLPEDYNPQDVATILNSMKNIILAVRGNCDAEADQQFLQFPMMTDSGFLYLEDTAVFATHGHIYGPQNPPPMVKGDVLLCAHTHVGAERTTDSYTYLNPGSLALPRDGHRSYMLYEDGTFSRLSIEGDVLGSWTIHS